MKHLPHSNLVMAKLAEHLSPVLFSGSEWKLKGFVFSGYCLIFYFIIDRIMF